MIDDLLYQYNPWWEDELNLSGIQPRNRQVEVVLSRMLEKRVVFLTGLRRVGKTTLIRLLVKQLLEHGTTPKDILYVSLDDYVLHKNTIIEIVSAYRKIHKISVDRSIILLFDEISYKDDYQLQLKNLIDRENVTILATSSSASLSRDQSMHLTGRSTTIEIQPLSFPEYLSFKDIKVARRDRQLLDAHFRDYARIGGLPEHVLRPSRDYLVELVDNIIQKDITAFHGLKDHQILRDYFTLLMERSGKQTSINKLGNILKISPDTSRRYLRYFEDTYLVHLVERWGKTNERILSPRKLYACDLGIKYLFIGERDLGSYFENYVYLQIRSHQQVFYLYKDGVEIDFFIPGKTLIEVKYNAELEGRQRELFEKHPADNKYVIDSIRALSLIDDLSNS